MLVSLTVGKVDAGVAVLLTQDNRLIEFPSVLLPSDITSGSIVDITVSRNLAAEASSVSAFQSLQKRILHTYGINTPSAPVLRLKNATQTSLVLEWDPINLATASLKSLSLYRNDSKAGSIPRPLEMRSTKISGLAIDTEYTFHLVLRTSAGTFSSQKLVCRTHKMTDLSGITVTPGIMPPEMRTSLENAVERIGAKIVDSIQIDTTHFVCTEGRGPSWEKAVEMNIPVVRPEWVDGCEREGTIVSVRGYYLNADPKLRQIGPGVGAHQNRQHAILNSSGAASVKSQNRGSISQSPPELKPEHREPPVTPFPGGPQNKMPHNGTDSDEDEPPPAPPKDNEDKMPTPSSDADKRTAEGNDDDDDDNDTEKVEENGISEVITNGNEAPKSPEPLSSEPQPEEDQGKPPEPSGNRPGSAKGKESSAKRNGNGSEGEMDDVPL
ncbi:chitin biosynthesis protein CHS5 [Coccidioides immitis RMSCC 3703]|uniref:Chitin biosynthesis protein CHS5 n=1 Tax=Coccidioides immitis RMSCC 3703 TaxID=454286 RepID=A0A0J8TTW0_COCIT|nr:chitin biosynthesis protein CHS5 [Coccidioides immitis RMSCC 3703]